MDLLLNGRKEVAKVKHVHSGISRFHKEYEEGGKWNPSIPGVMLNTWGRTFCSSHSCFIEHTVISFKEMIHSIPLIWAAFLQAKSAHISRKTLYQKHFNIQKAV